MSDISPLASADPTSLNDLFRTDPTTLTDRQLDALVAELQRRRSLFASEEAAKAAAGRKARPKVTDPVSPSERDKPPADINLDDL